MKRSSLLMALVFAAAVPSGAALSADLGTAQEARAMLDRAVAEMKKDSAAAIAKFNRPDGGFRDRDLYTFCATMDGVTTAHPTHVGTNLKELRDKKGKPFGAEMFKVAEEGKVNQVEYMWPKPGASEPVRKVTYVTKVAGQVCGVGYYK